MSAITELLRYGKFLGGGSGGGAFVLRPTEDELSGDFGMIMCTTNFDAMAKTLEAGSPVYVVLPESFNAPGGDVSGVKTVVSLITWTCMEADEMKAIIARFINFSNITNNVFSTIIFTNGTYVPNL